MSINFLLDFLFPKRCVNCGKVGNYICANCYSQIEFIEKPICPVCQRQAIGGKTHPGCKTPLGLDGLVVACRYRGPVKFAISKVKYRWAYNIAAILIDLLISSFWKFDFPHNTVLVPVPLHPRRKNWRGFNQAELIVESLSKKYKQPSGELLKRIVETKTQVGLSKKERKANIKGAFSLNESSGESKIRGGSFILVDDVYTSGATMQEAAKVFKRYGAKSVWGMAIALG